jgi:glycosyltransferase involved in cell wall biosynthesis
MMRDAKDKPLISVLTVVYNAAETLEKTINSVLEQTYRPIEYIVVDGNSTDHTLDILKKYSKKITWRSEPDEGIFDAVNKGLTLANGDFLIILGADDVFYSPSTIADFVSEVVVKNQVYYGKAVIKSTGAVSGGQFSAWKLALGCICHQVIFYPKIIYQKYKYNIKYKLNADYDYNLRLWAKYKFHYINQIISIYNDSGRSSTQKDNLFLKHKPKLIIKNLGLIYYIFDRVSVVCGLYALGKYFYDRFWRKYG